MDGLTDLLNKWFKVILHVNSIHCRMMATKIDSLLDRWSMVQLSLIDYSVESVKVSCKVWLMDELTDLTNEWFKVILHVISIHCRMMATKIDSLLAWYMKYGITIINCSISRARESITQSLIDGWIDWLNKWMI